MALATAAMLSPGTAIAGPLAGTTVRAELAVPDTGFTIGRGTAQVDAGVEFPLAVVFGATESADFGDGTLTLTRDTGDVASYGSAFVWTFLFDPAVSIAAITEIDDDFVGGATLSAFDAHSASFALGTGLVTPQTRHTARYAFTFAGAVPEPGSLALLGLGVASALVLSGRRQRASPPGPR